MAAQLSLSMRSSMSMRIWPSFARTSAKAEESMVKGLSDVETTW